MRLSPFLKTQPREPSGRPQRERVEDVIALAVKNRVEKFGVNPKFARSQMADSVFGRLRLQAIISQEQYETGCRFDRIVSRYRRVLSCPSPHPRSPSGDNIGGHDGDFDPLDDEQAYRARRDYDDAFRAVNEATGGKGYLYALKEIIVYNRDANVGDLRCGLNLLAHLWR